MQINIRWTAILIWLGVGCIAALSCSLTRPAAHIGPEYFPLGNDSFYHATRILDAVSEPKAFYQFDTKIHAPEGSLLVWPWGYDYLMAKVVRAAVAVGFGTDPLMVLLWIPVAAVFVGVGLLMVVARRLQLSDWPVALAGLCMALNASTQLLYGFGQIDHHYAEHIFILASLAVGLQWLRAPTATAGIALGATFGLALSVHNALFILQAPFLAAALMLWLQGVRAPMRPVVAFVVALVGTTLAVLLPSLPFQQGRFEFFTLSWFHLYVVCCTALVAVLLARMQPTRRSVLALVAIAIALLTPLMKQITYAHSFVSGSLGMLDQILEMRSPLHLLFEGQFASLIGFYSLLICVAPVTFGLSVIRLWRERQSPRVLFWIWSVVGLVLLTTQMRMHYFGAFALFLPWLIVAQERAEAQPELHKRVLLITSLLLVLAYTPVIRYALIEPIPRGGDEWFVRLHPIFPALHDTCEKDPGVVLSDTNAGHYIRYFSDCSVIANNFLLTEQQFKKADEVGRLFSLPIGQLSKQAPYLKYVLIRAGKIEPNENDRFSYDFYGLYAPGLSNTLLLGPPSQVPPQFKLLYEVRIQMREKHSRQLRDVPYAKLYKIEHAEVDASTVRRDMSGAAASVNNVAQ